MFQENFQSHKNQSFLYFSKKSYEYIFLKTLQDNSFYLFYKLTKSILLVYKNIEIFFSFVMNLFLAFRYFLLYTSSLLNLVFVILLAFSQIFIYLSNIFSTFIKIHAFSFIEISFIYTHFWKEYAQRSNFFIVFVANQIFKFLFTQRKLVRYYYFINIYIVY